MKFQSFIIAICLILGISLSSNAGNRKKYNFNSDWLIAVGDIVNGEKADLASHGTQFVHRGESPVYLVVADIDGAVKVE